MGFVGSDLEGVMSDHHKDAKRDGKTHKQMEQNRSDPAEVQK